MKTPVIKLFLLATIILQFALGFWGIVNIKTPMIATHFDMNGNPNGYMPLLLGALFMPGISLLIYVVTVIILPEIMPKKTSIKRSEQAYYIVNFAIFMVLLFSQGFVISNAVGAGIKINSITPFLIGGLMIIIGNYLPKTRQNFIMGIRNMWTLSDELVWDKTHNFAGPIFIAGGIFILVAPMFFASNNWIYIILGGSIIPALIAFVYSYMIARKLGKV